MVNSNGGISYDRALLMTRTEARQVHYGLAIAHGGSVNYDTGDVLPPKSVQDEVRSRL